ncbi:MAG: ribosome silencing factor [Candidatus Omnitrophica bacterium]|nr:ribosome silencing factor [Candidatus Omnitrophota bacterium]
MKELTSRDKAALIAELASEKKGESIVMLDMSGRTTTLFDWFVIVSAVSSRRLNGISNFIQQGLAKRELDPVNIEGKNNPMWVLLDYGDVVVHILHRDVRDFYGLERLWSDARMERYKS